MKRAHKQIKGAHKDGCGICFAHKSVTAFHTAPEQLSSSTYDFGPPIFISVFDGLMCCGNPIRSLRFDTVPPTILYLNSFFLLVNLMLQKFHSLHSVLLPISDHISVSADWLIFFCGNLILDQKKKWKELLESKPHP